MTPSAKPKQNPKRNHHVVPALYLKGFVATPGTKAIWMYSKGLPYCPGRSKRRNPFYTTIKQAGMVRDYYTDVKPDGTIDYEHHEDFLEQLEKPADKIFDELRAQRSITKEQKDIFAKYIVQMMKRTDETRGWVMENAERYLDQYYDHPECLRLTTGSNLEEKRRNLAVIVDALKKKESFKKGIHLGILGFINQSQTIDAIKRMTWRFLLAPTGEIFLAGDNPVFIFKHDGLNKPHSELSFPISSEIALWATWRKDFKDGFGPAAKQVVKELNRRTASEASKHLYASQDAEWIAALLNRDKHQLHYIP